VNHQQQKQHDIPRSAREQTKKLKKIIIFAFCAMLAFVIVYFIFSSFLTEAVTDTLYGYFPWLKDWLSGGAGNEYQGNDFTIIFYPVDYNYDIMKDKEYLELDRKIYYYADKTQLGTMIELDDSNRDKQAMGVTLICEMVESIIMGDADAYNACFSDYYFEHKQVEPDPGFTMTQLYDIKITNIMEQKVSDKKLGNYTEYHFVLQYSIHKNNGTFRTDIGSDGNAATYIIITDRNGKLLIEDMFYGYKFRH
jgi:hypothetical protein